MSQIADVDATRVIFRTFPATGRLYDGSVLERRADDNFLIERDEPMIAERICDGAIGPDGGKCVARAK
ncbi:hypothetical protein [Sphingosinithalassobacter portus]|uniref:hypothetical protein n=1 Tax=Stakelama portus TaxID=2676234 RepID=UPI0011AB435E|nr:hypothetical protein [Sphingosinithalassobacter portus]